MSTFPIVEKLGGLDCVYAHLKAKGLLKTRDAIRMWGSPNRGVIPGDAARELMRLADAEGIGYAAEDFAPQPDVPAEPPAPEAAPAPEGKAA